MSRDKIVFISDLHMGAGVGIDWLTLDARKQAAAFLSGLPTDDPTVGRLVLVGDTLDNWVWKDLGSQPPTFAQILALADNAAIVSAINSLIGNDVRVTFVQGNHDMDAWADLQPALQAAMPGIEYVADGVEIGPLWAEHGSRLAMFTAPDFKHDPGRGLPLGYFITRVHEAGLGKKKGASPVGATVGDVLRVYLLQYLGMEIQHATKAAMAGAQEKTMAASFIDKRLAEWVFKAIVANAGYKLADRVTMPGGSTLKLGDVANRYGDLYEDKEKELGKKRALRALVAEVDRMEPVARDVAEQRHKKAVLFGHSHKADLDTPPPLFYLNDGCFLRDTRGAFPRYPHFVRAAPVDGRWELSVWRLGRDGAREKYGAATVG